MILTEENLRNVLLTVCASVNGFRTRDLLLVEAATNPVDKLKAQCKAAAHGATLDTVENIGKAFNIKLRKD